MIKVLITRYSDKLNEDKAELYADERLVASATGNKIEINHYEINNHMVTVNGEDSIGHTFFHCEQIEDKRLVTATAKEIEEEYKRSY
jgi:hypothetical protein